MEKFKKTTIRMPETLHCTAKAKAAERGVTLEKVTNSLLSLWIKRGPGKVHVDLRPDGDIVMLTPEEIEAELVKLKRPRSMAVVPPPVEN